jgi:hypothetical protein
MVKCSETCAVILTQNPSQKWDKHNVLGLKLKHMTTSVDLKSLPKSLASALSSGLQTFSRFPYFQQVTTRLYQLGTEGSPNAC